MWFFSITLKCACKYKQKLCEDGDALQLTLSKISRKTSSNKRIKIDSEVEKAIKKQLEDQIEELPSLPQQLVLHLPNETEVQSSVSQGIVKYIMYLKYILQVLLY